MKDKQSELDTYEEVVEWMLKGINYNLFLRVDRKEMKKTQEFYKDQIEKDDRIHDKESFYNRIEWKVN